MRETLYGGVTEVDMVEGEDEKEIGNEGKGEK